ncbi:hypothetical protein BCR36DRAFT_341933 [Piromyces finnis]|uniref:Glucosidase 2 subunit beta n=1 Tax=Piromyces finnis TaxID=1754191 RepID=A0A1Y1VLU8_9FUNG|nr:hypothetical protein BCR36DRAFT_341933 [Piromyces finnis]|eukprot:ORX59878.1 hypothetical protein BCR36DRAFT_341933 [Piromyces finnis]
MKKRNYILNKYLINITLIITFFFKFSIEGSVEDKNNVRNKEIKIDKFYGIPDEKLQFYQPNEQNVFKCLDGSKTISYDSINDDYCDCPDGSDEPGTSACLNSMFYCKNKGHVPAYIPSSRVNDGTCDPECCDGSDEYSSDIQCPNICEKVSYEQNKEEIERKKVLKEGLAKKAKYLEDAANMIKKENEKKEKLELEINNLNVKIERLKEIQTIAENVDKRVQEIKEKEVNKIIIEKCPNVLKECNSEYNDINSELNINSKKVEKYEDGFQNISNLLDDIQNILTSDNNESKLNEVISSIRNIQDEIQNLQNEENEVDDEIIENVEDNNDEEDGTINNEKDKFPLNLDVDMNKFKKEFELSPCEDSSKNILICVGSGIKSLFIGMKENLNNDTKNLLGWKGWRRLKNPLNLTIKNIVNKVKKLNKISKDFRRSENGDDSRDFEFDINFEELKNNYLEVKSLIKSAQSSYDKKEKELNKIKEKTDIDFGPQNVFKTLYNKCYDVEASGYIYTLCLFKDAKQKPKDGNSSTNLGTWNGFDSPTVMKFSNGEKCWNGPQRSAKVILKCSDKNELSNVSEPSKCEYEMIFYTPAVCLEIDEKSGSNKKDEL